MSNRVRRYRFVGGGATIPTRYWSAFVILSSLALMATFNSTLAFIVFGAFVGGGLYGLFRPTEAGLFVELQEKHLVINGLTRRTIKYHDVTSADFYHYPQWSLLQVIVVLSNRLDALFGGSPPHIRPGEIDDTIVEIKFTKPMWFYIPFPPFVMRRASFVLRVEDCSSLRSAIRDALRSSNALERSE